MGRHCMDPMQLRDIRTNPVRKAMYQKTMKKRRVVLRRARRGHRDTAVFLMQKYQLRVWTQEELDLANRNLKRTGQTNNGITY